MKDRPAYNFSLKFQKHILVHTKFDKFSKLENIFVEFVVVDDGEDCLVQSLELFHVVDRHITQLNYAATTIHYIKC